MKPTYILLFAALGTMTAAQWLTQSFQRRQQHHRPNGNVLFLMSDEHTPKVLGCYGDKLVKTPTLDALAASGVRFTAAYCQNPICVPSRVSLVSGRMPCHLDTFGNSPNNQKYEGVTTLADVFVQAGYHAAWLGKTHWGNPRFQDPSGGLNEKLAACGDTPPTLSKIKKQLDYQVWPLAPGIGNLQMACGKESGASDHRRSARILDQNKGQKFFRSLIGQAAFSLHHSKAVLRDPDRCWSSPRASEKLIEELPAVSKRERAFYKHAEATPEEILRTKAIYYGMVTYVDEEFGRILKKLDDLGLRMNTINIYTADHGEIARRLRHLGTKTAFSTTVRQPSRSCGRS